jgi:hypothetical protein
MLSVRNLADGSLVSGPKCTANPGGPVTIRAPAFHLNSDNGFGVLRVKARGHRDVVTVVGHAAAFRATSRLRRQQTPLRAVILRP